MPPTAVPVVGLRPATLADCERLWRWRNDPATRRASFDEREIALDDHRRWLAAALADAAREVYVVLADGEAAGTVRLDRAGPEATVSIAIAPEVRGRGLGAAALRALVERAFAAGDVDRLVARVKPDNPASRAAFEAAGFRVVGEGEALTLAVTAEDHARGGASRRLESLWRGTFGRQYTDRNARAGDRRGRFWQGIIAETAPRRVLEVGCNVGANLRWIAPAVGPAGTVVGIDVNEYPLTRLALPGVRAAAAAARALPFRDGAFDLVFTMGVLIHQPPEALPVVMREIVRCSRRYVLCGEYHADTLTEVFYRGQHGALFKLDFGARYQEMFPGLALVKRGRLFEDDGWDDVTFWLFEQSAR
jgi:pseudaminic acid biosynthesis-associated methylase